MSEPVEVLKAWRDFTAELGKEDVIPDVERGHSDRCEASAKFDDAIQGVAPVNRPEIGRPTL